MTKLPYLREFQGISKRRKIQKNETLWEISKTITHKNWEPQLNECSEGKFHACSFPYFVMILEMKR